MRRPGQFGKPEMKPIEIKAVATEPSLVCSFAASLQPFCSNLLQSKREDKGGSFAGCSPDGGDFLPTKCTLRKNSGAQEDDYKDIHSSCCVCTPGSAANIDQKRPYISEIEKTCDY
jgi:hypothetical protein